MELVSDERAKIGGKRAREVFDQVLEANFDADLSASGDEYSIRVRRVKGGEDLKRLADIAIANDLDVGVGMNYLVLR